MCRLTTNKLQNLYKIYKEEGSLALSKDYQTRVSCEPR